MTVETSSAAGAAIPARARPIRFEDPERDAAYWARVDAIVDQAPPLTDGQRARLRSIFHRPATQEAA